MRTFVYVDGFNLYYRALRKTPYRWLDIRSLAAQLLSSRNEILAIKYYTARVSGRQDRDQPRRQRIYLKALQTTPGLQIYYGHFLSKTKRRPLVNPLAGRPSYVEIHDTEEKGSDVNLASHLIHDGWKGDYDVAVVISKDTDLVEPIRIVTQELKKPVGVISPDKWLSKELRTVASFVRHTTRRRLAVAQFPNPLHVDGENEPLSKPDRW